MDDARVGRSLHVLRRRRGLRQVDVAVRAGLSQSAISLIERGHVSSLSMRTVRRVFAALDAGFEGLVVWRGGDLDRVLDERHARLGALFAASMQRRGWLVQPEVTFSEYGERGSIDIVGLMPAAETALVVELKTEITSIEATLRRLDVKVRLLPRIVFDREGWRPANIGCLLVVLDGSTPRRRVERHAAILASALPARGQAVRRWLRSPSGQLRGLAFFPISNWGGSR